MSRDNYHMYTEEEKEFIRANRDTTCKELAKLFEEKFGIPRTRLSMEKAKERYECTSTKSYKFRKGFKLSENQLKYCFQKGQKPPQTLPVGTERERKDGYIRIKYADNKNAWKFKQNYVYEQAYGEIPKGYKVIFLDGNRKNFNLDNLYLVKASVLCKLNQYGFKTNDPEITKAGIKLAELILLTSKKERSKQNEKEKS